MRAYSVADDFSTRESLLFEKALLLSLLLHALLLAFRYPTHEIESAPIEVDLVPSGVPIKQIVEPPANRSEKAPEKATLRSDYNSIAEREQIKRGLPDSGPVIGKNRGAPAPQVDSKPAPKAPTAPVPPKQVSKPVEKSAPAEKAPAPHKSASLTLSESQVAETLASVSKSAPTKDTAKATQAPSITEERQRLQSERQLAQREPFSSSSAGSLFQGQSGSADYLPKLPDGDITLLNTKADQFAVFVRRVANQVFGAIRKRNWQELSYAETQAITHFVTVEVVMGPDGKLKSVRQLDSSGSLKFDEILRLAAKEGAWDQNPPAAAVATDGDIHFIFKSRTWSRRGGDGRFEQRWLLLGTGLL